MLCRFLVNRQLFKVKLRAEPFDKNMAGNLRTDICAALNITEEEARYFVLEGETANTTYDPAEERINILLKDGSVKDISEVDNALIHHNLASPVKKFYICFLDLQAMSYKSQEKPQ
jgi:hypothetical protein